MSEIGIKKLLNQFYFKYFQFIERVETVDSYLKHINDCSNVKEMLKFQGKMNEDTTKFHNCVTIIGQEEIRGILMLADREHQKFIIMIQIYRNAFENIIELQDQFEKKINLLEIEETLVGVHDNLA